MDSETSFDIDVATLARMRDAGEAHAVLDVREPWELAICAIDDSLNIAMRDMPARIADVPRDRPVVVVCHHGMRSFQVAAWLRRNGFANVVNLVGGIDAWARSLDPTMATY